jgi:hypothetical protein
MRRFAVVFGLAALTACAGAPPKLPILADVAATRVTPAAQDAAKRAPQVFAEAEALAKQATEAHDAGDDTSASLLAERAIATYQRAAILARASHATKDQADADAELAKNEADANTLAAARVAAAAQGDELAKRLAVLKALKTPASAEPADPQREAARLVAARSLAVQARLLCSAARLVSATAAGLGDAEKQAADLDKRLDGSPKPAPIDDAAKARVGCLDALTKARRDQTSTAKTLPDALLTELSAAGQAPTRDERGVVVTLRDVFRGAALAPDAQKALEALGRVAAAHGDVGVQIVVHDAAPLAGGAERAKTAAAVIVAGGAKADHVVSDTAGTKSPVVDPSDVKNRGRNARLEVVFVTPGA